MTPPAPTKPRVGDWMITPKRGPMKILEIIFTKENRPQLTAGEPLPGGRKVLVGWEGDPALLEWDTDRLAWRVRR